jgi:hypothetical protein
MLLSSASKAEPWPNIMRRAELVAPFRGVRKMRKSFTSAEVGDVDGGYGGLQRGVPRLEGYLSAGAVGIPRYVAVHEGLW